MTKKEKAYIRSVSSEYDIERYLAAIEADIDYYPANRISLNNGNNNGYIRYTGQCHCDEYASAKDLIEHCYYGDRF